MNGRFLPQSKLKGKVPFDFNPAIVKKYEIFLFFPLVHTEKCEV
jgi:hypothetical protein